MTTEKKCNDFMSKYTYYDKNGAKYNCRSGECGRYIELGNMSFLSETEISINTKETIKEQNDLHLYTKTNDYINKKSTILKIFSSIIKLFV
jgi:hypothetical protein